jgi:signal peptidase I
MTPVSDPRWGAGSAASGAQPNPADSRSGSGGPGDEETAGPRRQPRASQKPNRSLVRELPLLVVVALIIAIVIKTFVVQAFVIPTGSMQDTLEINDKILVNKLVYHFRPIRAGDIVVFNGAGSWDAPTPSAAASNLLERAYDDTLRKVFDSIGSLFGTPIGQTDYVKRVIGVPGDHVVCCNSAGLITVNGVPLHEQSYLYPGNLPGSHPYGIPGQFNVTVPRGYLWVLGDHRAVSDDSRGHEADPGNGMIPENEVIGRAFVIVWPPSQWRILPIPATFDQPGITKAANASAAAGASRDAVLPATIALRPEAPYLPWAAGVTGAVPLTWLRRRARVRRMRRRPHPAQGRPDSLPGRQARSASSRAGELVARWRRGRR